MTSSPVFNAIEGKSLPGKTCCIESLALNQCNKHK